MQQVIPSVSSALATDGSTEYVPVQASNYKSATEVDTEELVGSAGNLNSFRVKLTVAPGAGTSRTFVIRINGVDTALTVTVSNTDTTGYVASTVAVSAGDKLTIKSTMSGTPAAARLDCATTYTGTTAAESLVLGGSRNLSLASDTTTRYNAATWAGAANWGTTETDFVCVVPTGGTIKKLYVALATAPTVGSSRTFTLMLNGAATALTVTISGTDTTGNDTTHTFAVVAGDKLTMRSEGAVTPAATVNVRWGSVFLATTDGESLLMGNVSASDPTVTDVRYSAIAGHSSISATEANLAQLTEAVTISKFYVVMASTPVSGSYTFDVRVNSASPASNPSVTITNPATTGNDTTNSATTAAGDTIGLRLQRSADTTVVAYGWGLKMVIVASGLVNVKTVNGLAIASVKTINGLSIASVKTVNGLA